MLVAVIGFGIRGEGKLGGPPKAPEIPSVIDGCGDVAVQTLRRDGEQRVKRATLCLLNAQRRKAGLGPLRADAALEAAAEQHASDMAERDYFEHDSPEGRKPHQRIFAAGYPRDAVVGENLAWGELHEGTPARVVDGWMHSEGHRENILRREFREIGIGVAGDAPASGSLRDALTYVTTFGSGG